MIYGFIIAAGNQTRFNSDTPKALSKLKNKTCLDYTIENMSIICDKIFTVCSKEKEKYFENYDHIAIKSGLGCGDAVLKALDKIEFTDEDTCFIQWGDSINEFAVYPILKSNLSKNSDICVLYRTEYKPYVRLELDDNGSIKEVQFSKFDEVKDSGAHDLSVFYGKANSIKKYCKEFKKKFFKNGQYEHKHGNEFNFLDIFNDTDIPNNTYKLNYVRSCSFNTEKEYDTMVKKVERWEHF